MKMFLQGQWQERGTTAEVVHPYDGTVLDTVPVGTPVDITAALDGLEQGVAVKSFDEKGASFEEILVKIAEDNRRQEESPDET